MHIQRFFSWVSLQHRIEISFQEANGSVKWFLFGKCSLGGILGLTSDKTSTLQHWVLARKMEKNLKSDVYTGMWESTLVLRHVTDSVCPWRADADVIYVKLVFVSANLWHLILHPYIQWSDSWNTKFCVWYLCIFCEVYFLFSFWFARPRISVSNWSVTIHAGPLGS
jgi:hypothetical protein